MEKKYLWILRGLMGTSIIILIALFACRKNDIELFLDTHSFDLKDGKINVTEYVYVDDQKLTKEQYQEYLQNIELLKENRSVVVDTFKRAFELEDDALKTLGSEQFESNYKDSMTERELEIFKLFKVYTHCNSKTLREMTKCD